MKIKRKPFNHCPRNGFVEMRANEQVILTPMHDESGNYLHFCNYGEHSGPVGPVKARLCRARRCEYYVQYREDPTSKFDQKRRG